MGFVQCDSIYCLCYVKGYFWQFDIFCINMVWIGYVVGIGKFVGLDLCEMVLLDQIVIWGINVVVMQVNVMIYVIVVCKVWGVKIIVIDVYCIEIMKQVDIGLILKLGIDVVFVCVIMNVFFCDGYVDWGYLEKYIDVLDDLEVYF